MALTASLLIGVTWQWAHFAEGEHVQGRISESLYVDI